MDYMNLSDSGGCDIFYHEESKTLRNSRNEVVAYEDSGDWIPVQENFCSTYSRELQNVLMATISNFRFNNTEDLLLKLQQNFSEVKKKHLKHNHCLSNVSISLDIDKENIIYLQNRLGPTLSKLKIKYQKIKNPHVSTAYLVGEYDYKYLVDTIKVLSNFQFKFKAVGLEILPGGTTNKDYIVLNLEPDESFLKALNFIEKESDIIKFSGGFKTHISLFCVEKGLVKEDSLSNLKKIIEDKNLSLLHTMNIKPQSISLFNGDRLLELRQKIRSKL